MADLKDTQQSEITASGEGSSIPISEQKSKNAEKNEAKRLAKMAKFEAKNAKATEPAAISEAKKEKKVKSAKTTEPEEEFINTTPAGQKKDLSQPMANAYNPKAIESGWYSWWEKEKFFSPELINGKPKPAGLFVVAAPPPNVTGSLHIGHALTVAIQDSLVRWHRMQGKTVLFNPGTDHAGISCQSAVEKKLWHERGITRHDLGRDQFLEEIWKWVDKYGSRIHEQMKRLGGSYDWDRIRFTMDPPLNKAVRKTFIDLHEEGVIYRANRLVNWCVRLNTALSNLEVEQKEISGRTLLNVPGYDAKEKFEFGVLTEFAYEVEDTGEHIVVATTRPETMLGDTAVAVHPDDTRYKHLHGKYVKHPFINRRIPIITDAEIVDMSFGTGAVKITPAHDFNDYEAGKRNNLEFINILNDDGTFNENAGSFKGTKRFHARQAVIDALKERGLYVGSKDNAMSIPLCAKSGDVIEPLMKPQWWMDCKDMANEAMKAVSDGRLKIQPKTSEGDWFRWLDNIKDWCISRQLWWGHRVPAYFVRIEGEEHDSADGNYWVSANDEQEATAKASKKFAGKKFTLEQDGDVLDTWFSSGLWPFSIFAWPEKTEDLANFYPTSLLETGWDILFFWVARMAMFGLKLTGEVPFSHVFCHPMIRDAHGRKMSKTLGNVIDPIDVIEGIALERLHAKLLEGNLDPREIEKAKSGQKTDYPNGIPECGTDALRFALCAYTSANRDINLDILRVEGYRKFCNKLWNATKFALMKLGDNFVARPDAKLTGHESLSERWILHKLNKAAIEVNKYLEEKNFMLATNAIYQFWLYELCDVYIEIIKPITDNDEATTAKRSAQDTLYTCLEAGLKLLHPFMPFVTEELYQRLGRRPGDQIQTILLAPYPVEESSYNDEGAERDFDLVFSVIKSMRSLIVEYNVLSNAQVYIQTSNMTLSKLFSSQQQSIVTLTKGAKSLTIFSAEEQPPAGCALSTLSDELHVLLLVKGNVDIDAEVKKLEVKREKSEKALEALRKKVTAANYETKVPLDVREGNESKSKQYEAEIEALTKSIENFLKLKG